MKEKEPEDTTSESPTDRWERKHPWYKRPEIMLPTFGPILCAMLYGMWCVFSQHISDAWNVAQSQQRIERRVWRIEQALKIQDPIPFTFTETNNYYVADKLTTNFIDP